MTFNELLAASVAEIEAAVAVTEDLRVRAMYGYLDATFGTFRNAVDLDGNTFDATGNAIPYAPGDTVNLSFDWQHPIGESELYARADWSYTGQQYFDSANNPSLEIQSFDLLNLRVGLAASDRVGLSLRITNLGGTRYADRADYAFGDYRYFPGRGRAAFLEIGWKRD